MKEYLFTEFISRQWREFVIIFFTGVSLSVIYRCIRKYILARISFSSFRAFLELLFFVTAALFTGGVIDYCCNSRLTPYMVIGFILGILGAKLLIKD